MAPDQVSDMELRHLVSGEIHRGVTPRGEALDERCGIGARLGADPHEDVRFVSVAQPIVEFGDDSTSDRRAKLAISEFPK